MRRIAIIIFAIVGLIYIDSISKFMIESRTIVSSDFESRCHYIMENCLAYLPIIGEYIGIQLSYNSGVAFSLPIRGLTLQILTVLLIGGIIYHYIREEYDKKSTLLDAGYVLILGGAISHAYERIFEGHVIDFIAVKYFAILNFADIFISIGAFCIIVYYFLYAEHRSR